MVHTSIEILHRLEEPLRRRKPTIYFVNSMSDLFHEEMPDSYIRQVFDVIRRAPQHTFQVLTPIAGQICMPIDNQGRSASRSSGLTVMTWYIPLRFAIMSRRNSRIESLEYPSSLRSCISRRSARSSASCGDL